MKFEPDRVKAFPKAFNWLTRARAANGDLERFMALWLSAEIVASYGVQRGDARLCERLGQYVATMGLPDSERDNLVDRLRRAYNVRNMLVHKGRDEGITPALLESLDADVYRLVEHEFAKLA